MNDRMKTSMSCFSAVSMMVLPLIVLSIGWIGWGLKIGMIAALVTFAFFFLLAGFLLSTLREPSRLATFLPLLFGSTYTILPDFLPGPLDDTIIFTSGALLSFSLWLRRNPDTPRWIIIPLMTASVYTLVGGFIPGPVDELLVYVILGGITAANTRRHLTASKSNSLSSGIAPEEFPPDTM